MRAAALNLMLLCILLLIHCDAKENSSLNCSAAGLYFLPAADGLASGQDIEDFYYSLDTELLSARTPSAPLSLARSTEDLNGDHHRPG